MKTQVTNHYNPARFMRLQIVGNNHTLEVYNLWRSPQWRLWWIIAGPLIQNELKYNKIYTM